MRLTVALDTANNRLILTGGIVQCCTSFNDVWVLTNANGSGGDQQWIKLAPTGPSGLPSPRGAHSAVYDPSSNRLIIFGGGQFNGNVYSALFNDAWVLTNANGLGGDPEWIPLNPAGSLPQARATHHAVYDAVTNRMIIYGGSNNGIMDVPSDVWALTNANGLGGTPAWVQVTPDGGLAPRIENHVMEFDAVSNRMMTFGGCCAINNSVRVLTNANGSGGVPEWSLLAPIGTPPAARMTLVFGYNANKNRLIIFGHGVAGEYFNDVWVLTNANGLGGTQSWIGTIPNGALGSPDTANATAVGSAYDPVANRIIFLRAGTDVPPDEGIQVWVLSNASALSGAENPTCGDGELDVDVGEECDPGSPNADDCCDDACHFSAAMTDCEDGDSITCPDKCDGAGVCVAGHDESTECRNSCCDGVDNDGDESTDIEDSGCGLGQESRTAVVTTSPKRNAIRMGGRVNIASLDLEIDRPDCDEPYIYRTEAGICGERMSLRKNGEVGFIATLATPAVSGSQPIVFGKGFDIRSHWVSVGMPAESQEPPPLVGPGGCNSGSESCTQPLTPLDPGDDCPSASAGACCPDPSALCTGRLALFDPANPHVFTDGSDPDYARCQALRTELAASSDAVAALPPNHPAYSDVDDPERIRVLPATPIPANCDNVDEDPAACTAACAQYCTVTLGAGQQVLYVDSIDVKRNVALRLCRDFNLTPSDPPTVAIIRIEDKFALSPGARIEACGVPPDRILWNAEGEKGSVKFARGADLIGTVLAPRRKSIKFGGDATLKGSLFAPIVTFSKFTEMYHYPFSAGIE